MAVGAAASVVGGVGSMMKDSEDDEGGAEMDMLSEESPTGSGFAPVIPTYTPAEGLLDYDRLRMPGPEVSGARGKLSQTSEFDAVFAIGVSVQVDVVMAVLSTWQQRWYKVTHLALPPLSLIHI